MILTGARHIMDLADGAYDGHAHVFLSSLPMETGRRYTPNYDALPGNLCGLLSANQLDGALLVQPSFLGTDNSYLLETLQRLAGHPELTFRGVVVMGPEQDARAMPPGDMDQLGVVGVRLNLIGKAESFNYEDWRPALAKAERLGWHVELHIEAEHLERVLPILTRHHAKVVIDHFGLIGNPDTCQGLKTILAQPRDRIWIKASGAYRVEQVARRNGQQAKISELLEIYLNRFGPEQIIWGSDWPFAQFEDLVTYSDTLTLVPSSLEST